MSVFGQTEVLQGLVLSLIVAPWLIAAVVLCSAKPLMRILTSLCMVGLSIVSFILLFYSSAPLKFMVPQVLNGVMITLDILLLLYFFWQAILKKNILVGILSVVQASLFMYILKILPQGLHGNQFYVDKLSIFMFLLINVVSGIICVYSLKYIDEEDISAQRKRIFIAILLWFIGVMNFIVSVDNLEWFFLLFEGTTLASYLLIRFRKDTESVNNALRALWMNQIGGVAILLAIIYALKINDFNTVSISELVEKGAATGIIVPFTLLAIAALIKGAQLPFSSWLLGAMVAPTPVSALLHSSTMVKLAPFIILRISPAIQGTPLAMAIMLSCGFVFLVSAISALVKDNFKLILAQSTIALLALMIMTAAIGTETAVMACLFLIMFHGVSKCLLFLNAGILEKFFHIKSTLKIHKLGEIGPWTSFFIATGFLSLMLPPFGAFIGKWLTVELLADNLTKFDSVGKIGSIIIITLVALGSAVLTVLYLKVIGSLITRSGRVMNFASEAISSYYKYTAIALIALLFLGIIFLHPISSNYLAPITNEILNGTTDFQVLDFNLIFGIPKLAFWPMLGAVVLLPLVVIFSYFVHFKQVDRVKEYSCGENLDLEMGSYYFDFDYLNPYFIAIGIMFFVSIMLSGRVIF